MDQYRVILVLLIELFNLQFGVVTARPPLKIINGTTAADGEFPYMVQVLASGYSHCGGSILSPEWILTAAHCVDSVFYYSVVYGTNKARGYPNVTINVKNSYQHPNFQHTYEGIPFYDVGLIQLAEPIPFSESAQPIQLAEENTPIPFHVDGVLSGWGIEDDWGHTPEYLQKITLQLLTDEECTKIINDYAEFDAFTPIHHLCTNDNHNGESSGDSGSPYVIDGIQYALSSWSIYPGQVSGAYTRLTNPEYRDWIRNITSI